MLATPGGTTYQWGIQRGSSPNWHTYASLADYGAGTESVGDLARFRIHRRPGNPSTRSSALPRRAARKGLHWEQTSAGSPFVGTLVSKLNPGASYAASTTTRSSAGQLWQPHPIAVTDYANPPGDGARYNFAYLNGSSYAALYIFNRMTSATATPSGGSPVR